MGAASLVEFVREFNRGNVAESKSSTGAEMLAKCTLAIWSRTKMIRDELKAASWNNASGGAWKSHAGMLTSPVVLRFIIPDVLTAYISLIFANVESALIVESVTAFGPRERVRLDNRFADDVADDWVWNDQVEVAARAVGLFSVSRADAAYWEDDTVASTRGRPKPGGGDSVRFSCVADVYLVDRPCLVPRVVCGRLYGLSAGALGRGPYSACRKNMGAETCRRGRCGWCGGALGAATRQLCVLLTPFSVGRRRIYS